MRGAQEPLLDLFGFHRRVVVLPAAAVHHLLVGQHGLALRAPVHQAALAVGQPALQHAQEKPLVPAVIFRLAGGNFAPPVVAEAEAPADRLHLRDVGVGPIARRRAALDGRIFGRQAEGVPADGVQHVEAAHAAIARHRVADGVIAHVAHVQRAGGIRQHLQQIIFRAAGIGVGRERASGVPSLSPLRLDCLRIVFGHDDLALGCARGLAARLGALGALRRLRWIRGVFTIVERALRALAPTRRAPALSMLKPFCGVAAPASPRSPRVPTTARTLRRSSPGASMGVSRMKRPPGSGLRGHRRRKLADGQDAPKRLQADIALADVLVPIHARTERRLRIVHVQHGNALEPHGAIERRNRLRKPRFGVDFVAGFEGMRRVQTNSQRQIRRGVEDRSQLLEARAHRRAHARSVFEQQRASGSRADRQTRRTGACRARPAGWPCATSRIACSELLPAPGVYPQHDPGCTTRKSAPSAAPRTISS